MISKPIEISATGGGGIDRSASETARNFNVDDVLKDMVVYPKAKRVLRDGYGQIFGTRDNWFEATTLHADRDILANVHATLGATITYNSLRKKCVVEMTSSGTRYLFAGIVNLKTPLITLDLFRGTISAAGVVTWDTTPYTVFSGSDGAGFVYLGDDNLNSDQQWIEFSMSKKSDNTELYVACVTRDDDAAAVGFNKSTLRVAKLTTLFTAGFAATVTQTALELNSGGDTTITIDNAANDAISHDLDIAVDVLDGISVAYGYYNSTSNLYEIHIRRVSADYYDTEPYILTAAGYHLYGLALLYNTAQSRMMLFYIKDLVAGADEEIRFVQWTNTASDPSPDSGATQITATLAIFSTTGGLFANAPAVTIDSSGDVHLLYRKDATGGLYYAFYDYGGSVNPVDLSGVFDIEESDGTTLHSGLASYLHNWDMVVRGSGATLSVHIYYVENHATSGRVIRLANSFDVGGGSLSAGSFTVYGQVVHTSESVTTPRVGFLCSDRTTQTRASRQLIFLDFDADGAGDVDFMHLTQMLDGAQGDVSIEAMHEYNMPQTDDTTVQTIVIQCSDSRFRKRSSSDPVWYELENTMDVNNARENWWRRLAPSLANGGLALTTAPDPTPHARFDDDGGVLRAGLGVGSKIVPVNYRVINRYFGNNTASNKYTDHYLDVDPLQPPSAVNIGPSDQIGADVTKIFSFGTMYRPLVGASYAVGQWPLSPFYHYNYTPFLEIHSVPADQNFNEIPFDDNVKLADEFNPTWKNEGDWQVKYFMLSAFKIALSFIYDNREESQLFHPSDAYYQNPFSTAQLNHIQSYVGRGFPKSGIVYLGIVKGNQENLQGWGATKVYGMGYIAVPLAIKSWNNVFGNTGAETRGDITSPRVTGIRIWMAEVPSADIPKERLDFKPVKHVVVSQREAFDTTANNTHGAGTVQPAGKAWNGEVEWDLSAGSFYLVNDKIMVIDLIDWIEAQKSGGYDQINGHSDIDFDSTLGLHRSPMIESYRSGRTFNGKRIIGGIRRDGVDRPGRITSSSLRTELGFGNYTPSVFSDDNDIDLPFNYAGIASLDEDTAIILGDRGFAIIDIGDMLIREKELGLGTLSNDGILEVTGGRNVVQFLSENRIHAIDGNGVRIVSEQITRDSVDAVYPGIANLSVKNDVWAYYLPNRKEALWFFRQSSSDIKCFRYDFKMRAWSQFDFNDDFKCGCVGVDGELLWSSGYKIFNYPSGTSDNGTGINPAYGTAHASAPEEGALDISDVFTTYKTASGKTLALAVVRDRGALSNLSHTLDASTSPIADWRQMNLDNGREADREVALIYTASATTSLEIERVKVKANIYRRQS